MSGERLKGEFAETLVLPSLPRTIHDGLEGQADSPLTLLARPAPASATTASVAVATAVGVEVVVLAVVLCRLSSSDAAWDALGSFAVNMVGSLLSRV